MAWGRFLLSATKDKMKTDTCALLSLDDYK